MIQIKNKVIISDPCYSKTNQWLLQQDNMLEGDYNHYIEKYEDRIKSIEIVHSDYKRPKKWKLGNQSIGVDSGQAGIFCDSIYPEEDTGEYGDKDSFYGKCCELTMQNYNEAKNYDDLIRTIQVTESLNKDGFVKDMVEWQRDYHKEYIEALESVDKYLAFHKKRCDDIPRKENDTYKWEDYIDHFTKDFYQSNESQWHHKLHKLYNDYLATRQLPEQPKIISFGIIDNKGLVSRSGYGDGCYPCYFKFNSKNKCIGVKIRFI